MTGFGRARGPAGSQRTAEVVVRSVNGRHLDLSIRTRDSDAALEPSLRRVFSRHLHRGKVEVALRLKRTGSGGPEIAIDEPLLDGLLARLRTLSGRYPIEPTLSFRDLLAVPQLLSIENGIEEFTAEDLAALESVAEQAALALVGMRESEGAGIAAEIGPRIAALREKAGGLESRREEIARNHAATLRERIKALLPDVALDPGRVEQEAALAADRSDVAEELQRLRGHLDQFDALLARPTESVGKTLDFLCQEILRELNTLASKSRDLTSTREILEMKAQIEKIREQVQNVE